MLNFEDLKIGIIGLGYVGLPLAVEFAEKRDVIAFDINDLRIQELKKGLDKTREVDVSKLKDNKRLRFTNDEEKLRTCNFFIITVPTPIDHEKRPDLLPLRSATHTVAKYINKRDIIVFESTVYPGAIEEECVPILENGSGLLFNVDFFCGYSPERINPGDKEHTIRDIIKITSGSTEKSSLFIDSVYREIIDAGTHRATSIKVAEAAKVIENTQRDLNIALMNELSIIFHKIGIDTSEVLDAAKTKWNFYPFTPGLVGGHCIGVDPYYLTYKAEQLGYKPELILAGRRINDSVPFNIARDIVKNLVKRKVDLNECRVLVAGIAFKENCPDTRNSKVVDLVLELEEHDIDTDVYDPFVDKEEVKLSFGLDLLEEIDSNHYDALILAVPHSIIVNQHLSMLLQSLKPEGFLYDVKASLPMAVSNMRL